MEEMNLGIYTYFVLGIVLGLAIGVYFFADREEKYKKKSKFNSEYSPLKNWIKH